MSRERRIQTSVLPTEGVCTLCGAGLMLVTSRKARGGLDWLNPLWDAEVQQHEVCTACRARSELR